jgi:hypothetical protein
MEVRRINIKQYSADLKINILDKADAGMPVPP